MIENIRKQYPQYNDLSDQELADAFHSKYYSDLPKDQFYNKIGLSGPSLLGKIANIPSKIGSTAAEFLMETGPALGEKAVGLTQLGAETLGYQDFSKRLGEITAKERESLTTTQKVGRTVLGSLPEIAVGGAAFKGMQAITKPSTFGKIASLTGAGIASGATGGITEVRQEGDIKDRLIGTAGRASLEGVLTPATAGVAKIAGKGYNFLKNVFTKGSPEQFAKEKLSPIVAKQALEELYKSPAGKPTTGIDIQQPEFQEFSRSVISRYPSSRMIAEDFAKGRNAQALDRINKDLNILSKTDDAETYLAQLDNTKKILVDPLYKKAYEEGSDIGKLAQATQEQRQKIYQQAVGNNELSIDDLNRIASQYDEALKIMKQTKPKSLLQFIKESGGISDVGGELKSFDLNNKTLPGLLRKNGPLIDDVGEKLTEAGYFQERPTVSQVLDLIDQEMRGKKVFLPSSNQVAFDEASTLINQIESAGIDVEAIKLLNKPIAVIQNKEIQDLISDPRMAQALKTARKDFGIKAPNNSIEALHGARQAINDIESVAIKQGEYNKARSYKLLRDKITNVIYKSSPSFKEADEIYNKYTSMQDTINLGRDFSKKTPEQIKKDFLDIKSKSKLSLPEIQDNYRIGVRDALVKQAQKAIKFEGTNIPTKIQVKSFIENEYKKGQLKTIFPTEQSFNKFVDNVNQEVIYNKVLSDLNLTKASIEQNRPNFIRNAFNYLLSNKLTGYGTTGAVVNVSRAGEEILIRNYKNLNEANAKALAKILTNRNATIKLLESVIKNADKSQKEVVSQVVRDIYQPLATSKVITEPTFTE